MGRHTLEGNPPIDVTLRASARAKRLSLRVSRLDGRVTLTMPVRTPAREGIAFLQSKESWLRRHLSDLRPVEVVQVGGSISVGGREMPVVASDGKRAALRDDALVVSAGAAAGPQVKGLLRHLARDRLVAASDRYAAALGRSYSKISIRDTRSRWGSCSSQGGLMYSWRLIMAPPDVLDYVAAHEVAHLVEMNHSAAFWATVARICPGYEVRRQWLRTHGDRLHRVSFDD